MDKNENENEQPRPIGALIGSHPQPESWPIAKAYADELNTTSARPAGEESAALILRLPTIEEETEREAAAFRLGTGNLRLVEDPYVRDLLIECRMLSAIPAGMGLRRDRPTVIPAHQPGYAVRPEPMSDDMWPTQHGFDACWRCQDLDQPIVERALRVAWLWLGRGSVVELAVCDNCASDLFKYDPDWMA